ncbi:hypothetical protein MA16_Dca001641 [Dendrobium catenatum]|uniref:Uncharacterized protein n=1 Tax=Dendrobium catenatum TaxID=906689 RepID=A0A2I0WMZ8_9ASPA|nr:hypothetical protein MA16_Dca001641 [Dendrobium catenatum]
MVMVPRRYIPDFKPAKKGRIHIIKSSNDATVESKSKSMKRSNVKPTFGKRSTSIIPRYEMQTLIATTTIKKKFRTNFPNSFTDRFKNKDPLIQ